MLGGSYGDLLARSGSGEFFFLNLFKKKKKWKILGCYTLIYI
jgi:hypothetical protein